MVEAHLPRSAPRTADRLGPLRLWHYDLLVLLVAVAITNVKDQRRTEPALIALASAGFGAYAFLGWLGWQVARRFERRLGPARLLIVYLAAMAGLFLAATVAYLAIEYVYLTRHL
jgi:hypothetical protein